MAASSSSRRRHGIRLAWSHVVSFFAGCCVATMLLTAFHGNMLHELHDLESHFAEKQFQNPVLQAHVVKEPICVGGDCRQHHSKHEVAGLDCSQHGGVGTSGILGRSEMVYWEDLPLDNEYVSPLKSKATRQYMTFEPGEFS